MSGPRAVGLLCLALVEDQAVAEARLRNIASGAGRRLTETVAYQPGDEWLPQLRKIIADTRAITVAVLTEEHYAGEAMAITALNVTITTPDRTLTYLSVRGGFRS